VDDLVIHNMYLTLNGSLDIDQDPEDLNLVPRSGQGWHTHGKAQATKQQDFGTASISNPNHRIYLKPTGQASYNDLRGHSIPQSLRSFVAQVGRDLDNDLDVIMTVLRFTALLLMRGSFRLGWP
jgi:hypothetical protein